MGIYLLLLQELPVIHLWPQDQAGDKSSALIRDHHSCAFVIGPHQPGLRAMLSADMWAVGYVYKSFVRQKFWLRHESYSGNGALLGAGSDEGRDVSVRAELNRRRHVPQQEPNVVEEDENPIFEWRPLVSLSSLLTRASQL